MIKKIYCFNEHRETIFRKTYRSTMGDQCIEDAVLSNKDINFIETQDLIVYKRFEPLYVCFVVQDENEMYILNLITLLMRQMGKLLEHLNEKSIIYNFRDVDRMIDNFILDGKVISMDCSSIFTSSCN